RHRVVHERAGEQLAVLVIDHFLPEGLGHALSHATMHLAIDNHGVDHIAAVIHGDVPVEGDFACFGVYVYLRDVHAIGVGEVHGVEEGNLVEAGLQALGEVVPGVGGVGDILEGDGARVG